METMQVSSFAGGILNALKEEIAKRSSQDKKLAGGSCQLADLGRNQL
jgi:hypothetical protein